jgi:tRNA G18 (ribose-2'-O)-methylase SpoU
VSPRIAIEDPADPRLAEYVDLRDVNLRKLLDAEHGIFIAEGEKVIRRAAETGYEPRSFLLTPRWLDSLADVLERWPDVPVYVVTPELAEQVTGFHVHRGALASYHRRPVRTLTSVLDGAARILVLEDLVDHTNVGAIFRCAAALGIDGLVLSPRCADPLYRRAVKVSMGAVFAIPYTRMADWHDGLTAVREAGFRLLALTPADDAVSLDDVDTDGRIALMLGSEGHGLSSRWLHEADQAVRIAMSPKAMELGVDSLNVVAAAAIACHTLARP